MGFWKFSREAGSKTLEIQAGGGLNLKKSSAGVILTNSSCDSSASTPPLCNFTLATLKSWLFSVMIKIKKSKTTDLLSHFCTLYFLGFFFFI